MVVWAQDKGRTSRHGKEMDGWDRRLAWKSSHVWLLWWIPQAKIRQGYSVIISPQWAWKTITAQRTNHVMMARRIGKSIGQINYDAGKMWNRQIRPECPVLDLGSCEWGGLHYMALSWTNQEWLIRPSILWEEGPLQIHASRTQSVDAPEQGSAPRGETCPK